MRASVVKSRDVAGRAFHEEEGAAFLGGGLEGVEPRVDAHVRVERASSERFELERAPVQGGREAGQPEFGVVGAVGLSTPGKRAREDEDGQERGRCSHVTRFHADSS